jgi:glycosyltransferase involved in cell wall biosynthesis
MRIALASIHPRPLSGQIEGLVGLAQALEARGHTVKVVSAFPSQTLLGPERLKLAGKPHRMFVDEPFRMMRILFNLVRLAPHVDVIQLNLPTPAFSLFADLLQRSVRVPVIAGYEAHLVSPPDLLRLDRLREAPEFYLPRLLVNNRLVARLALHRATRYVVSSKYQKAELMALGVERRRIRLLPNILPHDKIARAPRETVRAQLPPGRLITYVGHYNHVKGVDVLVRAFQELAPRFPDLHLVLAWSGQGARQPIEQRRREAGLNGRVVELGRLHVPDLFGASDVVVLPYRLTIGQAAYPATLLEALAANVPVVTTDLPLLRELTQDGKTALLAPPDDYAALAAAIARVLDEPALVQQMLEAQQQWIEQIHPQYVVRSYEQLYEQVTACQEAVLRSAPDCEQV